MLTINSNIKINTRNKLPLIITKAETGYTIGNRGKN